MDRGMILFLGILLTFSSSWLGLVFAPFVQLNNEQPQVDDATGTAYPQPLAGLEAQGRRVYQANGCIYCHSQQVRPESFANNADIQRGWGGRRTVARDYLYDRPHLMGTMRTGPDLSNIGERNPSPVWHHIHLYNPRITSPGSIMAPFAFLYEKRKIVGEPSDEALPLEGEWAVEPGYQIVPTSDAKALVAYLLSLKKASASNPLPEAKE